MILYHILLYTLYIKLAIMGYDAVFSTTETKMEGFTVTAYCPCEKCNGRWKNISIEGYRLKEDFLDNAINICAVDPKIIPLGSYIKYNGITFWAKDIGGEIKGKRIDILLSTHEDTIKFGKKMKQILYKEK